MMDRNTWNDRPVTFIEFSIRQSKPIIDAFVRDGEEGSYLMLVAALRYTDSGEPVFSSVDQIYDLPFRHRDRLAYLAGRCAFVNGMRNVDPAVADAAGAQPNGHADEAPGPSP